MMTNHPLRGRTCKEALILKNNNQMKTDTDKTDTNYIPQIEIDNKYPDIFGMNIIIGVFKPHIINGKGGYGTMLPKISYSEAKELYRQLRKTLIQIKHAKQTNS